MQKKIVKALNYTNYTKIIITAFMGHIPYHISTKQIIIKSSAQNKISPKVF